MMDDRKRRITRWLEGLFGEEQTALTAALFEPTAVVHTAAGPRSPQIYGPMAIGIHAAMSDPHITVQQMVAEGDTVVARWTLHGSHTEGPAYGLAPSGVEVAVPGVSFLAFSDADRVREIWDIEATHALMRQLGVRLPRAQDAPAE